MDYEDAKNKACYIPLVIQKNNVVTNKHSLNMAMFENINSLTTSTCRTTN